MSISTGKPMANVSAVRHAEMQSIIKRSEADAQHQSTEQNSRKPTKRKNSEWRDTWLNIKASIAAMF